MFSLERQHLRPVTKNIDIKSNYETSISRCVHKDNTIRYLSNRYSLPLGTFRKYETVCIMEDDDKQLIIYIPETGEVIAKHAIPDGKGILIKDRKHNRDRTKGIDAFINTVAQEFMDSEPAFEYLQAVKEKYPRYIRDQLQMILKETKANHKKRLTAALNGCIKRNLYSATDFSDVVSYLKRQRQHNGTVITNNDENVAALSKVSGWVMETEAQ